jgi:multidrug efflux pump subunit AcrB
MVEFLIKRPIATLMSFIAIVMLGLIASGRIPISLLPDINIPEITIHVSKENTSLHELESSVVTPIRKQLLQVPGVKDIKSETKNNQALIRLIFEYGVDIDYAFIEVNDKIDVAMAYMPKDVQRPRIIKASASDIPVFYISVSNKNKTNNDLSFLQLSEFVNNVVKKRIEQLPEVAIADISGIVFPEIYIIPYLDKFQSLGLNISDIQNAFNENNLNHGSLLVRDGHYQFNVMFDNKLKTIDDIRNILIQKGNRVFSLNELAEIGVRPQERNGLFLNGSKESVNLAIIKHSSAQMNKMKFEVENVLESFQKDYPEIDFEISQDQTLLLNYSINNLKLSLILGSVLAVLIMFLFIENPRAPLLIAFSIPISLIISMLIFYIIGISINIISLSGLILGVGMMIDNSIIVIDNISQSLSRGDNLIKGIINGTNEVIRPLITSVLTTSAVFIPLIFLSGISGALFYDQAMAVTIGLFVSLIVSVTLIPVLFKLFRVDHIKNRKFQFVLFDLEKYYAIWIKKIFRYRRIVFPLFFLFILLGVVLFVQIEKRQMPKLDQQELIVRIDWNESISIDVSKERIEQIIKSCNNIRQSNSYLGVQNFLLNKSLDLDVNECQVYIRADNSKDILEIETQFKDVMADNYSLAKITYDPPENVFQKVFSGTDDVLLSLEVSTLKGDLLPTQDNIDLFCETVNREIPNLSFSSIPKQMNLNLNINHQNLILYGVQQENLQLVVKDAFNQNQIGQIVSQNSFIPIVTGKKKQSINKILRNTFIKNDVGDQIPLLSLLTVDKKGDYKSIVSNEGGAYIPVKIDTESQFVSQNLEKIKSITQTFSDLNVNYTGSWFETQRLIKEMSIVLLISLLLLYFILAAQFESLLQPLIVLIEVPIDIGGALLFLYLFNSSINILSLIGIVVMSGIIINDSILKIDTINKLRLNGYSLMDAIHTGGTRRVKPILMTSLTTILALMPFLFGRDMGSELQYPLALAIIGGLIIGTIVSLFFIPLIYYFLHKERT